MPQDLIRYDVLVQDALRSVVRKVISEVAKTGLPGDHHFYVSFDTQHPGVRLSNRIRQRYPEEMTIVLQHQYWDLTANDTALEVGLSFNGIPERLLVPYTAIKGFFDPSVQFGLQFEVAREGGAEAPTEDAAPAGPVAVPAPMLAAVPKSTEPTALPIKPVESKPKPVEAKTEAAPKADPAAKLEPVAKAEPAAKPRSIKAVPSVEPPADVNAPAANPSATVISIDTFRKKP